MVTSNGQLKMRLLKGGRELPYSRVHFRLQMSFMLFFTHVYVARGLKESDMTEQLNQVIASKRDRKRHIRIGLHFNKFLLNVECFSFQSKPCDHLLFWYEKNGSSWGCFSGSWIKWWSFCFISLGWHKIFSSRVPASWSPAFNLRFTKYQSGP